MTSVNFKSDFKPDMVPGKDILGVRDYYNGKAILMTGGTGYIGKIIIEKMIRCLPQIKRIYVMVRSKKEMSG
jgi:FlaA1/EpsC-like NDP-sugar epimerase